MSGADFEIYSNKLITSPNSFIQDKFLFSLLYKELLPLNGSILPSTLITTVSLGFKDFMLRDFPVPDFPSTITKFDINFSVFIFV